MFIDSDVLPLSLAPPPKNKPQHFLLCTNSEAILHYVYISKYTRVRVAVLSLGKCSAIKLLWSMCMEISNTVQLDTGANVFNPLQWLNNTVQHLLTKFKCMPAVILPSSTSQQEKFTSEYTWKTILLDTLQHYAKHFQFHFSSSYFKLGRSHVVLKLRGSPCAGEAP